MNKKKEHRTLVRCSLACTLPQVLRQINLLQNCEVAGVGGRWSYLPCWGLSPDNRIFVRAEATNTRLIEDLRGSTDCVDDVGGRAVGWRTHSGKRVTALGARTQNVVNQASVGDSRNAGRCWPTQGCQGERVASGRKGRLISHFGRVNGTNGADGGRLIGRNTRTQQVRDRDGRNDQDDRHHNQQLDK